jgi:hypothetical protein
MEYIQIFREGIILNDFNDGNTRISEIYHSNKIHKITLNKGELVESLIINDCCVDLSNINNISQKINALKKYENSLKIANCNKYIIENKNNPFASRMNYVKKELAQLKKENKNLN